MGGLIQTKGTQRLARLFNDVFSETATGISLARRVKNNVAGGETLTQSFKKLGNSLLEISDAFIAQNAIPPNLGPGTPTWPDGGNDVLYPSATMKVDSVPAGPPNVLRFVLPAGCSMPTYIITDAAVSCIKGGRKKILRETTVTGVVPVGGGVFDVALSKPTTAVKGDFVSFAKGKHQMLVRRWRWYLKNDLRAENDAAIKQAISSALSDTDFQKITFQAIEETQKVVTRTETLLGDDMEFDDKYNLHIVLLTEQTTAPDALDPQ